MKLLFGTGNKAKVSVMRSCLPKDRIELTDLEDMRAQGYVIPQVAEDGATPLENARQKAQAYYAAFHVPVFSCDSGLYFENVPDEIQPGVHVRTIHGKYLTDEEMLAYYTGLVRKYGKLTAYYKNAICLILDDKSCYEAMDETLESDRFTLTDKPHSAIRRKGFPLDSISLDIRSGRYFYDLPSEKVDELATGWEFAAFFDKVLNQQEK